MFLILFLYLTLSATAVPVNIFHKAAENDFEENDNYLPKIGDFPKFHYATFGKSVSTDDNELFNLIDFKSDLGESFSNKTKARQIESPKTLGTVMDFVKDGAAAGMDLLKDIKKMFISATKPETNVTEYETTTISNETTTDAENITTFLDEKSLLDPVLLDDNNTTSNRTARQESSEEDDDDIEVNNNTNNNNPRENQDDEEEEEEDENMITGLISAFLGGLSRPDGSVDIEAITGLLGSLSTQNDDGTYDFNGLTELLMSFFGGDQDGGGSNFGAFIGGLLGAFIKGVANPPGAKGAGVFVGNILGGVLPGLSAPAPTEEGDTQPQKPLDSGGFLGGLLSSVFGNLATLSSGSSGGGGDNNAGGGSKFSLFKAIFQVITSVFSSSSATH